MKLNDDQIEALGSALANRQDPMEELKDLIWWMNNDLDENVSEVYKLQPLAQDWARVAKLGEEAGEAIDALIGWSGQNPRKGVYGGWPELADELADVALTALYAMQHFTHNRDETIGRLLDRARHHKARREAQLNGEAS